MQSLSAALRRRLGKEPEHPGRVAYLALALLVGCLAVWMGLFRGFRGWMTLIWFSFALYWALWGIAEFLPVRRRGAAAVLRTTGFFTVLGMFAYLVVATIAFNL